MLIKLTMFQVVLVGILSSLRWSQMLMLRPYLGYFILLFQFCSQDLVSFSDNDVDLAEMIRQRLEALW